MRDIVLASESRYRRELMDRLGVPYAAVPHRFEETDDPSRPYEHVAYLARCKAQSLLDTYPEALIIGSDQILMSADGEWLGKPGDDDGAVAQLLKMAGRTHELITAVALIDAKSGDVFEGLDIHKMTVRQLSEASLRRYVAADQPLDCAGSFRIEGLGIALFSRIEGQDPTAIMGLPLMLLVDLLSRAGVHVL